VLNTFGEEHGMALSNEVVVRVGASGFRAEVSTQGHDFLADEPPQAGGGDGGPTPYALLVAALGSCAAMTLRTHADRKGWPLEEVTVRLRHGRTHGQDCDDCESHKVGIDRIERVIELSGPLTDEQRSALLRVADRCPVGQTLTHGVRVLPGTVAQRTRGDRRTPH
jgi:putative redox protein